MYALKMNEIAKLLLVIGTLIATGTNSKRWENDLDSPWIDQESTVRHGFNIKGISDPLLRGGRMRRNKEKIPLMIGKGSAINMNKKKVNGLLSDLKVDCSTDEGCSEYLQSVCTGAQLCNCTSLYPVFIASQKSCIKPAAMNASCSFIEQCAHTDAYSECDATKKICVCMTDYFLKDFPDIGSSCVTKSQSIDDEIDPTMITVLVGLGLMFVIICVVLRLFAKARFRENRSIFNTPNPRLMNASLFKDKRRGSALSNISATGSAAGSTANMRAMSASREDKKGHHETTVAIEAVD